MVICDIDKEYLKNPIGAPSIRLEALDSHGASLVYSITDVCETSVVLHFSNVYMLLLKNI